MKETKIKNSNGYLICKYYRNNNNQINGLFIDCYPKNRLKYRFNFINGKRFGLSTKYRSNGDVIIKNNYINDTLCGLTTNYNDGEISRQIYYL